MILEFSILSAAIVLSAVMISLAITHVKLFTVAPTEIKRDNISSNKENLEPQRPAGNQEKKYKENTTINDANLPLGLLKAPPKPQGGFGVKQD